MGLKKKPRGSHGGGGSGGVEAGLQVLSWRRGTSNRERIFLNDGRNKITLGVTGDGSVRF